MPFNASVRGSYGATGRFGAAGGGILYAFTSHTFTTGGKHGRFGPTLASLQSAYSGQSWAQNALYFSQGRAEGYQVWTVPQTGIYQIEAAGSRGSDGAGTNAYGKGAIMRARFTLSASDKLEILVGQQPSDTSDNAAINVSGAAAGGGGTFVVIYNTTTPLIIAGGGGGRYSSATTDAIRSGQTKRQPLYAGYNYSPASSGSNPAIGYGGSGYHAGGGGGLLGGGIPYPGRSLADSAAGIDNRAGGQAYTHGASFNGSNDFGTYYGIGGNASGYANVLGGFGGGGGGHSGNNTGGGGGGYSGGLGGQTSLGGSYNDGVGGGSFFAASATNMATSDGYYDDSNAGITSIGSYNDGPGYVIITKL